MPEPKFKTQAMDDEIDTVKVKKEDVKKMADEIADKKLEAMQKEIDALKAEKEEIQQEHGIGEWKPKVKGSERNQTAKLKLYRERSEEDWGLIVDFKFNRKEFDEDTRQHDKLIYKITMLYEDGETKDIELDAKTWAQIQDVEEVEIVEMERKELVKSHGDVYVAAKDRGGYTLSSGIGDSAVKGAKTDRSVPLEEVKMEELATVKRKSGQTFKIPANKLNS